MVDQRAVNDESHLRIMKEAYGALTEEAKDRLDEEAKEFNIEDAIECILSQCEEGVLHGPDVPTRRELESHPRYARGIDNPEQERFEVSQGPTVDLESLKQHGEEGESICQFDERLRVERILYRYRNGDWQPEVE